ncbi:hypothetical protein BVRB_5g102370 [Beta vulgaris subsp. vulgaris]|nr:hypothetical protein BVRB_5g102370 [Beta vulgaris subsp. vulgaris]
MGSGFRLVGALSFFQISKNQVCSRVLASEVIATAPFTSGGAVAEAAVRFLVMRWLARWCSTLAVGSTTIRLKLY